MKVKVDSMEIFNIIAGVCSIISFIISVVSLFVVNNVRKKIDIHISQHGDNNKNSVNNLGQSIQADNITNSPINQIGVKKK